MSGLYDATGLARPDGVRGIRQTGPKTFELVVDDAGTATAEAVQSMSASGGEVESVREIRPTFEDVFAHLVERDRASRAADPDDAAYEAEEGDRPRDPDAPPEPYTPRAASGRDEVE
jgi:hypothetical protein